MVRVWEADDLHRKRGEKERMKNNAIVLSICVHICDNRASFGMTSINLQANFINIFWNLIEGYFIFPFKDLGFLDKRRMRNVFYISIFILFFSNEIGVWVIGL